MDNIGAYSRGPISVMAFSTSFVRVRLGVLCSASLAVVISKNYALDVAHIGSHADITGAANRNCTA